MKNGVFSFGCGDIEGVATSLEEMRLIVQMKGEYRRRSDRITELRKIQWGHRFRWDRRCECGLYQMAFVLTDEADRSCCPIAIRKVE